MTISFVSPTNGVAQAQRNDIKTHTSAVERSGWNGIEIGTNGITQPTSLIKSSRGKAGQGRSRQVKEGQAKTS